MNLINAGLKDTDFNKAESLLRKGEIFSLGDRNDLVIHYDASFLPDSSPYRYGNVPLDSTWKHLSRWMMEEKIQFPCLCWVSLNANKRDEQLIEGAVIDIITGSRDDTFYKALSGMSWTSILPLTEEELKLYGNLR